MLDAILTRVFGVQSGVSMLKTSVSGYRHACPAGARRSGMIAATYLLIWKAPSLWLNQMRPNIDLSCVRF